MRYKVMLALGSTYVEARRVEVDDGVLAFYDGTVFEPLVVRMFARHAWVEVTPEPVTEV